MAMVEKAVSSLFQGVSQTGQAVASVAESLHATDYQNDRFSAILQQLIDEVMPGDCLTDAWSKLASRFGHMSCGRAIAADNAPG